MIVSNEQSKIFSYGDAIALLAEDGTLLYEVEDIWDKWVFAIKETQSFLKSREIIIDLFIGKEHMSNYRLYAYLTSYGNLYVSGANTFFQIGTGMSVDQLTPINIIEKFKLKNIEEITSVSFGSVTTVALSSFGRVFVWGYNEDGILGDGTKINKKIPKDITAFFNLSKGDYIVQVCVSYKTHFALSKEGEIFIWGENFFNQNSNALELVIKFPLNIKEKLALQNDEKVVKISVGGQHLGILTNLNKVIMWGYNRFGQIGDGTDYNFRKTPVDITRNFKLIKGEKIKDIVLGTDHSFAYTTNMNVFT